MQPVIRPPSALRGSVLDLRHAPRRLRARHRLLSGSAGAARRGPGAARPHHDPRGAREPVRRPPVPARLAARGRGAAGHDHRTPREPRGGPLSSISCADANHDRVLHRLKLRGTGRRSGGRNSRDLARRRGGDDPLGRRRLRGNPRRTDGLLQAGDGTARATGRDHRPPPRPPLIPTSSPPLIPVPSS